MAVPCDGELLADLAGAPEEAATFFWRHAVPVAGMAVCRAAAIEDAITVTAETFAVALTGASHFRGTDSARGWLFAIAGRTLADAARTGHISDRGRGALGIAGAWIAGDADLAAANTELRARFGASPAALVADLPAGEREAALVWSGCRARSRGTLIVPPSLTHAPGSMPWSSGLLDLLGAVGDELTAATIRARPRRPGVARHVRRAAALATTRRRAAP